MSWAVCVVCLMRAGRSGLGENVLAVVHATQAVVVRLGLQALHKVGILGKPPAT